MNPTEQTVDAEVVAILKGLGMACPMLSVKACYSGSSTWKRGYPNGMFSIDIWSLKRHGNYRDRGHMFRTNKAGVVPVAKITEWAKGRLEAIDLAAKAEKAQAKAAVSNEELAKRLRDLGNANTSKYFSSYKGGTMISADSGVEGKVKINLGDLTVDEAQAEQLLSFMATHFPKKD